jgi:hypothetical protein
MEQHHSGKVDTEVNCPFAIVISVVHPTLRFKVKRKFAPLTRGNLAKNQRAS